jgi:hypothetical protein
MECLLCNILMGSIVIKVGLDSLLSIELSLTVER